MSTHKDTEARQQAIDPACSCIIQAPAGSGKTGLLIQRYLCLLATVEYPEEIMAITFTRKAAAEMQGRVMRALGEAQADRQADDPHHALTLDLARAALKRDAARNWGILNSPVRLRIQTIDALCAWLSRQMPILSGFGAPPTISDEVEVLYRQAALQVITDDLSDTDSDAVATLLEHFDNNMSRAVQLMVSMLPKRDQWLRHAVQHHDRKAMEQVLQALIEEALDALVEAFPQQHAKNLCRCLHYAASHLIKMNVEHPLVDCGGMAVLPGSALQDLGKWLAIRKSLLTDKGQWRRRVDQRGGFLGPADGGDRQQKQAMQSLLESLADQEALRIHLADLKHLPNAVYSDTEWHTVQALCHCLVLAEAKLRVLFAEHNCTDYIGMAQAALNALGEDDAPSDLNLYLDYRIQHVLVDEFQDISVSQYRMLCQICEAWTAGDGHSLFLVGDPMQSIYGFREAEVGFFLDTFRLCRLAQLPLVPLRLSVNFRSNASLVDWNNDCFQSILPAQEDIASGAVAHTASVSSKPNDPEQTAVTVYPSFDQDDAKEAEQVQTVVQALRRSHPEDNIAILVRNRTHLQRIIPSLRETAIPFCAVDIEALAARSAIQDVLALTCACLHPADRIAWLAVLRAPWCGLSLADLHHISDLAGARTIWTALQDEEAWSLATATHNTLLRFRAVMQEAQGSHRHLGLRRAVENLWLSLGGPATLENAHDIENVGVFFDLLERFDVGGRIDQVVQFKAALQDLFATAEPATAGHVQLMTIHKAKGLEFDHVLLPGLHRRSRQEEREMVCWLLRRNQRQGHSLIIAPIEPTGAESGATYDYVREFHRRKGHCELQRLLYVACTRARHSLHLFAAAKLHVGKSDKPPQCQATAGSLLHELWPVLEAQFVDRMDDGPPIQNQSLSALKPDRVLQSRSLSRLHPDWQLPSAESPFQGRVTVARGLEGEKQVAGIQYDWAGAMIRHVGTVVHNILQQCPSVQRPDPASVAVLDGQIKRMLADAGVHDAEMNTALERVQTALEKMFQDERGQWILDSKHQEQRNEYALSGHIDGALITVVIDRSFVAADGTRWIIDYKTSTHRGKGADLAVFLDREQERYQGQMENYLHLVRAKYPDQPIRSALYFPLLQGWREYPQSE